MNKSPADKARDYVSTDPKTDWERFKDSVRKLMSVSKSEVDKSISFPKDKKSYLRTPRKSAKIK